MRTQPADLIKTCADHNIINYMVLVEMLIMMQMTQVLSVVGATSSDSGRYLCRVYNQVSAFLFRFLVRPLRSNLMRSPL